MISATIVGSLGRDAELRDAKGTPVVSFSIASNEGYGDKKTTTWTRVSFFGHRAEKVIPFLIKGKSVACRGSLSLREYTGKDGTTKTSLELRADDIELLGGGNKDQATNGARTVARAAAHHTDEFSMGGDDGEIPF
jgi:single-strand DNA-binding protein